jgi:hypothetical protein
MNKTEYQRYLQSSHWTQVRARRLAAAGYQCEFKPIVGGENDMKHGPYYGERCTATYGLEVHHKHYQSLGREKNQDLEVLCRFHHLVREAVGSLDCPECGDGPMNYDEADILEAVNEAVLECGGIDKVTVQDVRDWASEVIHCSYCER